MHNVTQEGAGRGSAGTFGELASKWAALISRLDGRGTLRETSTATGTPTKTATAGSGSSSSDAELRALSSSFNEVWGDGSAPTTDDFVALWHAARASSREWAMTCLLRACLRSPPAYSHSPSAQVTPERGPVRGPAASGGGVAKGALALALVCWAAAVAGEQRWFYREYRAPLKALVRGACQRAHLADAADTPQSYKGAAVSLTFTLYGWFEAVMLAASRADVVGVLASETDVLHFLEHVGIEVVQPSVEVPRPSALAIPSPPPLTVHAVLAASRGSNEPPLSPSTRVGVGRGLSYGAPSSPMPVTPSSRRGSTVSMPVPPPPARGTWEPSQRGSRATNGARDGMPAAAVVTATTAQTASPLLRRNHNGLSTLPSAAPSWPAPPLVTVSSEAKATRSSVEKPRRVTQSRHDRANAKASSRAAANPVGSSAGKRQKTGEGGHDGCSVL